MTALLLLLGWQELSELSGRQQGGGGRKRFRQREQQGQRSWGKSSMGVCRKEGTTLWLRPEKERS